jgi:cell division septation protein DedD
MMKRDLLKFSFLLLGSSTLLLTACKKDKEEENEEEVITTLQLTFVPVGGGATVTYKYDDPDGPGGSNPTTDEIVLQPNKTYGVAVQLLNKTVNPAENITEEVEDEADAHRFYYEPSAGSNITVSNFNNDINGVPVGITSTWTTGAAATGTVKITLRHYAGNPPNKAAADPVNSPKSATDIEVSFNTKLQ